MSFELKKDNSFVRKMAREFDNGLRKCPFCGGNAISEGLGGWVWIRCEHCETQTAVFTTLNDAIRAWNRRVSDETINGRP